MNRSWYRAGSVHFVSTVPARRRCPSCRTLTLVGFDGGIPLVVDHEPLAAGRELEILIRGGWTYDRLPDRTLRRREPAQIAAGMTVPVWGDHACPGGRR